MLYNEMFSSCVLWVLCVIGNTLSISNGPALSKTTNQAPDRRFYFYNPEILSHAASALGMVVPQTFYKPMGASLGPSLAPVHFADYGDEEEEEIEEHEEKHPLQLFTIVKPPKMAKHNKKKKKMKGHQQHKPLHQFKKYVKKCLPFKVRIIKKSDIDNNDDLFSQNIRSQLPYGYGDEYFPQPPDKQELAVISLNTSNISENGARFPQVLHFLYPRYNIQQPRPNPRIPPPRKSFRFARPYPKRPPFKKVPKRPWPKVNPWRVAPAGRPVSEYPLKEPTPDAVGGSPPPSPLLNLYKDHTIPVNQVYAVDEQTESGYNKAIPHYIHVQSTTPTQIQYHQEQWSKPLSEPNLDVRYYEKYSDPDYYRYGTYNQNQLHQKDHGYIQEDNPNDQEIQYNTNYDTISHSYHNFATTSEKIITVTPTTSWVPIPQLRGKEHERIKLRNISSSDNKQVHYLGDGIKKDSSNFEEGSYKFGDKIIAPRNCSLSRNCLEQTENIQGGKEKSHRRVPISRGSSKYENKQEGLNLETGSVKRAQNKKNQNRINSSNGQFYIEGVPAEQNQNVTRTKNSTYNLNLSRGRSDNQEAQSETEIVTAKHPQDNLNEIYTHITPSISSARVQRSNFRGLSAVVSGSMLVKEN